MSRIRLVVGLCALMIVIALSSRIASAHADYVSSDPPADGTVAAAPQALTINFSQLLEADGNSITVVDAAGATVSDGAAERVASNERALSIALQPGLGAGTYTVRWETVSAEDGEAHDGEFQFTVAGSGSGGGAAASPAAGGAAQSPQATAEANRLPDTGTSSASIVLMLAAAVALAAGAALRRTRI